MSAPELKPHPSTANPPPAGGAPWIAILAVLVILGGGGYYYWAHNAPDATAGAPGAGGGTGAGAGGARGGGAGGGRRGGSQSVPVTTATVKQGEMNVYLTEIGTVTAWDTTTVHARVDGLLLKFDVNDGDRVTEGQPLAELDSSTYSYALEQAEGKLLSDQALLDNAKKDVARYTLAGEAAPTQSLDLAVATAAQYAGMVRTDAGIRDTDKLQLDWCTIKAPTAGRVGIRLVDAGNLIHASDATGLIVITQDQPIAVFFNIPEDALPSVRPALDAGPPPSVEAYDRDLSHALATGTVIALDNAIDATTGTVRLKAEFANEDGSLFPNQFVNVRLLVQTLPDSILIPNAAVQINGPSRYVYVVGGDGKVEQRVVETGPQDGDTIAITKGLAVGEVVVTEGLDKLQTGTVVSVKGSGGGRRGRGARSSRGDAAGPGDPAGRGADQPAATTAP